MTDPNERYRIRAELLRRRGILTELICRGMGLRYNENHDPANGRVTSGPGGSSGKGLTEGGGSGKLKSSSRLSDIEIGRSVGAKAANYLVMDLETRELCHFAEGTHIRNVQVFAGKGSKSVFRKADKYAKKYGGNSSDWQHVKGIGTLDTSEGYRLAEVHWVQCEGIGKYEFFVKEWLD